MARAAIALVASCAAKPLFTWDTVQPYWHATDPDHELDDATAEYAATHAVIIPNGNNGRNVEPVDRDEEEKLVTLARRLKQLNTSATLFFYMNSMMDWEQYELHHWLRNNRPEWWTVNKRGDIVCMNGQPLFNFTLADMRAKWLNTVARAMAELAGDGGLLYGGAFADRANLLPKGSAPQPGPGQEAPNGIFQVSNGSCLSDGLPPFQYTAEDYNDWSTGHATLLADLQTKIGDGAIAIANNNQTVGVQGRQFERWCNSDFDGETIDGNIQVMQRAVERGQLVLVHGGEPCSEAALSLSLAAFLMGAGERSYFTCTDAWHVADGWARDQRHAEYDRPLGAPLGTASRVASGGVVTWERHFASGTWSTLRVAETSKDIGEGCVYWASGEVTGGANCSQPVLM